MEGSLQLTLLALSDFQLKPGADCVLLYIRPSMSHRVSCCLCVLLQMVSDIALQRIEVDDYIELFSPALEWLLQNIGTLHFV